MRQLEKRQMILLGILAVVIVAFVVWKFALSSDEGKQSVEPVTTQTTVATGQVTTDPANPAPVTGTPETGAVAPAPAPVAVDPPFDTFAYRDPFQRAD